MKSIEVKLQNRNIALQVNVKDLNKCVTIISKELIQDLSFDNSKKYVYYFKIHVRAKIVINVFRIFNLYF